MAKAIEVPISELKNSFYVRCILNQDHVLYLMGLIDGGVDVGPIKITKDLRVIDGRHRIEAYKHLDIPMVSAIVEEDGDILTFVGKALGANIGGALPPTRRDIEHTVSDLLKSGISRDRIVNQLSQYLPRSFLRVAYQQAIAAINRQKVNKAISLLTETPTLTVKKVSELVEIDPRYVQDALDKMNKKSLNGKWLSTTKLTLRSRFTHFNKSNGKLVQGIFKDFDDAEITEKELTEALNYLGQLIANENRIWQDWDRRFKARISK